MNVIGPQNFDVIIAGAGIVGSACALACALAGLKVALVERDAVASGATSAAMGHIVVMNDSPAQFALTHRSRLLWRALSPTLPPEAEYETPGTLWIAADDEELEEAQRKQAWLTEYGVACRMQTAGELSELEPNLRQGLAGALLVNDDAIVNPTAAAQHLAARAQSLGACLFFGKSIDHLGNGEAILADGTHLYAPRLVNALGADASTLTSGLPIRKRKGHLVITDPAAGFVHHQLVELGYLKSAHLITADSVAFNVQPRPNGQIIVGSSRQFGDEVPAVDSGILETMLERAYEYMPALSALTLQRSWTGFRAATPDKLPLIGPASSDPTLWLATGHEGLGITTSLSTAELIAAHLTGSAPAIAPEPYLPARFASAHATHLEPQENS